MNKAEKMNLSNLEKFYVFKGRTLNRVQSLQNYYENVITLGKEIDLIEQSINDINSLFEKSLPKNVINNILGVTK